ncbi:MAG: hypothetical protein ABIW76_07940 [Fibrobacteria bacterium]
MTDFPFRLHLIAITAFLVVAAAAPLRAGSVLGDDFNEDESHDYSGLPRWRLNLESGYSQWMYNPDSLTPSYERYLNTLESGMNLAADLVWFPWDKGGVGLTWIWFLSKASQNDVQTDSGAVARHRLRDRASYVYYGPVFMSRLRAGRFGLLVGSCSGGWMNVNYTLSDNGAPGEVKASAFAVVANVGWEYAVYRLVSFGINGRVLLCNIAKYTYNGKQIDINDHAGPNQWRNIGMSRFELDAGIRFGL